MQARCSGGPARSLLPAGSLARSPHPESLLAHADSRRGVQNRYERVTVESDARVHHDSLLSALGVAGIEDHYSYKGKSPTPVATHRTRLVWFGVGYWPIKSLPLLSPSCRLISVMACS